MKSKLSFIFCLAILALLGCNREEPIEISNDYVDKVSSESFVSEDMVRNLLEGKKLNTKASSSSFTLEAYTDSSQDTLMYIVNYGESEGWQLLSSDSRTPAILGESSTGRFSLENGSEGFRIWIACMAQDIKAVRNSSDEELTFTADEIAAHKSFWGKNPTRDHLPPELPWDGGQWHETSTQVVEVVDSIPHITVTQWDQWAPYNYYCPYNSFGVDHCPAGCAAIAGAQMLYYLHSKYGVPTTMYSGAMIVNNQPYFFNESSTVWSQMTTTNMSYSGLSSVPESPFISLIGQALETTYQDSLASATGSLLKTRVFNYYGYDCTSGSYSVSSVKTSLLNGDPLVIFASDSFLPWEAGHAFIIDGYKRTRIHTITYHYYADGEGSSIPGYPDYYTHSYTDPEITSIKMNWGWWTQWSSDPNTFHLNDGWYALTGGWVANSGTVNNPNMHTYQYYLSIISNFSLSNN